MTRARNLAGLGTVTAQPTVTTPVHLGPLGVVTATRYYGTFDHTNIIATSIATTDIQISGITTGLNVSGIITAQNGLNVTGNITNGLNVSAGIATLQALTATTGTFTGDTTFAGTVSIAGTVTYEDITDIDSVGVGTFRKGIIVAGVSTFNSGLNVSGNITNGLNVSAGIATFAGAIDANSTSNFGDDVTFTGATSGRDVFWDKSANTLLVKDNAFLNIGTGNDLQIYHNSGNNHSYISEQGSGSLIILADDLYIQDTSTNSMIQCIEGAQVQLHYNGVKAIETNANGIEVFAPEGSDGIIRLSADERDDDPDKWRFLASSSASELKIQNYNSGAWETNIECNGDGSVEIYHNSHKSLETNTNGINLLAPEGQDVVLDLYADEGDDNADKWRITASAAGSWYLKNSAPGSWDTFIAATVNAGLEFYYDNSKTFETISGGVQATGKLKLADGGHTSGNRLCIGTSDDLTIWHVAGNDTYFRNITGDTYLQGNNSGTAVNNIKFESSDGSTELFYNSNKKFNTYNDGIYIHGQLNVAAAEGDAAQLSLITDEGDDDGDIWTMYNSTDNTLTYSNNESGSLVNKLWLQKEGHFGLGDALTDSTYDDTTGQSFYYKKNKGSISWSNDRYAAWAACYINKTNVANGSDDRFVQFQWSGNMVGKITSNGSATTYHTSSDYRLKENIVDISDGITRLKQLKPRRFNWIADETNKVEDGFIAHEVSDLIPEAVSGTKDKVITQAEYDIQEEQAVGTPVYQTMDYAKVTPLLTAALQEAIAKIENLEQRLADAGL